MLHSDCAPCQVPSSKCEAKARTSAQMSTCTDTFAVGAGKHGAAKGRLPPHSIVSTHPEPTAKSGSVSPPNHQF